jgi:two-component system, chemotaxis family, CheB/CheR fusion protein
VTDNGKGFPAEFRSRLFQRFQQSDRQLSRQGLGLGLSIVRHIAELHGGTVEGRSEGLFKGATFVVTLPLNADVQIPKATKRA